MSRRARAVAAVAMVALAGGGLAGLAGCKKKAKTPPAAVRVPPMPAAEVTRGKAACDDLVAKLCACSAAQPAKPELAEACQMKKAKPEALALALETAVRDDVAPDVALRSQQAARTIIEKCVQEVAALPTLGCR
ncbi:MAG: hypothetical protein IPH44_35250 [Myxococcales bacterium]|nr:hypothetical protein [Myxococcales bacterium]